MFYHTWTVLWVAYMQGFRHWEKLPPVVDFEFYCSEIVLEYARVTRYILYRGAGSY